MAQRYQPGTQTSASSWLRIARISRDMSQRELADVTGLTQVAISHIESRPGKQPRRSTKQLLALTLGYEVDDLFPSNGRSPHPELRRVARREQQRLK